ncbi:MAG: hypothetical protein ABL958_05605 [Bdellovibrionia bacterium]
MRYFHILLFSLFLHVALVSLLDKVPDERKEQLPIEVVYPDAFPNGQVVRETEKKDIKETEEKRRARFQSEYNKRFKEESRVRDSGMTANAGGGSPKQGTPDEKKEGPGQNRIAKQFVPMANPMLPPGPGTGPRAAVGEKLPDSVKFGNFNALNSDRFLYYSFFARIEEGIRPRWEMSVREVVRSADPAVYRHNEWLMNLEIILDRTGKFHKAVVHKKSGLDPLDVATIDAFRAGAPFQNPPQEMVQADGRIHLFYAISVSR